MKYQYFIEKHFDIINKQGKVVPFILWNTQDRYLLDLEQTYTNDYIGIRDILLKARKEGFSSLILAVFACDFLTSDNPIASVCISDKIGETKKLFNRARFFIESALKKKNLTMNDICDLSSANEIRNKETGATFWIGTAGSKVASRVETVQNLHFSEAAHFPDTDIITARETIEGALQMVEQGTGKVFIESTARGYGNYYQQLWSLAQQGKSEFRPVFFSASELYSKEWLDKKRRQFTSDEMFMQEYPETPEEAFIASGSKFFSFEGLNYIQAIKKQPIQEGQLSYGGEWV